MAGGARARTLEKRTFVAQDRAVAGQPARRDEGLRQAVMSLRAGPAPRPVLVASLARAGAAATALRAAGGPGASARGPRGVAPPAPARAGPAGGNGGAPPPAPPI